MKLRTLGTLLALISAQPLMAQKGNKKNDSEMKPVVPEELIPPAPVLSPEDALKSFKVADGFEIEVVVTEPLVEKPVALTFDPAGRMWVVEMLGYMQNIDGTNEEDPLGRIVILEDTDGDGQVDDRKIFLEDLVLPRAVALVPGGILYGDQQNLYFVERDGDKPKGEARIVDPTFADGGNVEHKANGLMTNLDNWMYNTKSASRYKFADGEVIKENTYRRGQWGIGHDNLGRIYHNTNSKLLFGDRLLPNLLEGNPSIKMKAKIATTVGTDRVYPDRVTPGLNRAYRHPKNGLKKGQQSTLDPKTHKLVNTSAACGPAIYRGTNWPEKYQDHAIVCESAAQLVKLIKVKHDDGKITGSHPLGESELLTSQDERFRPVNAYNAPDGSIYILDYYHGIIQHSTYMTSYLRKQTLSRGLEGPAFGHGRIYRIKAKNKPLDPVVDLGQLSDDELILKIASKNGEVRDLAQKELVDRKVSADLVRTTLQKATNTVFPQIHLIWILEGIGALEAADLVPAIDSDDENLVITAMYAGLSLTDAERIKLVPRVADLEDTNAYLPYKAKFLSSCPDLGAHEALVALLKGNRKAPFVKEAAAAGLPGHVDFFKKAGGMSIKDKKFKGWVRKTEKGPQKEVDPASLLSGAHLASYHRGQELYKGAATCFGCHGPDGEGAVGMGPHLNKSEWVTGDDERLAKVLLHGLSGPIWMGKKKFTTPMVMPGSNANPYMTDERIADVMTYIRSAWDNRAGMITPEQVAKVRKATVGQGVYTQEDFPELIPEGKK